MNPIPRLPPHTAEVMTIFGLNGADVADMLFWSLDRDRNEMRFHANCSDTFHWGSADGEEILFEDMPLLRECYQDLKAVDCLHALSELFSARKRGMRPMALWMEREPPEVQALFPE